MHRNINGEEIGAPRKHGLARCKRDQLEDVSFGKRKGSKDADFEAITKAVLRKAMGEQR